MASETKQACSKRIMRGYTLTTCGADGRVEREGKWYCKRHDPVAIKAKDEAKYATRSAEWAARRKEQDRINLCVQFHERLVEALQHDHWRNHEFSEGCTACTKSRTLLSEISKAAE